MFFTFSDFQFLEGFVIELFDGAGATFYFNLNSYLQLGDFYQLRNLDVLHNCKLDELGGLVWECGVSFSKNTLMAHAYKK